MPRTDPDQVEATMLVFVPADPDRWRDALQARPVVGHAATPGLLEEFGYGPADDEQAEHAAMVLASVAGLAQYGRRGVLACEVPPSTISTDPAHPDTPNGRVEVDSIDPSRVVSWFTDEADLDVSTAARAASGLGLDRAWETPEVASLVEECALLWHAAEELPGRGED
ncbi:DUF6912 family protein [Aestuariimicrobium ganziense]|uniref:DUF6912 family protein n=1 Tax=Aestuariimicrobium ganziense TaxID=2773677 RepID=UPI0019459226|nr:hypothetical protein [Aestuariimicrobium ganziense]